jgi:hypothetical protein
VTDQRARSLPVGGEGGCLFVFRREGKTRYLHVEWFLWDIAEYCTINDDDGGDKVVFFESYSWSGPFYDTT